MKLYIYDHCPFCVRARMILGLKNIAVEQIVLLDNDHETPIRMIGKKMLPILEKDDGSYLPESLDIVHYIDQLSEKKYATGVLSPQIETWSKAVSGVVSKLVTPRFVETDFPEISTNEARAAYKERTSKSYGDLAEFRKETHTLLVELAPQMSLLDVWLENRGETIDINDFYIFPTLRSLSIVAGLAFSSNIRNYMDKMSHITKVDLLFDKAK
ncbi:MULTISPECIES: glutaredoxin 2 [Providencia]|uniref:glutaredoxin 2 n=1 Tax=Providencia TaxID=586 RepID=UPI00197FE487|nr:MULTISPECIES: glutaredoxin 2 [Providencia]HEC8327324.1 glutaredoxin 2 [Providencia rettgeri]MBN4865045.1 glutaredoxin 2 [Providencia stuartii]MBN4874730.1 glutaredoxin 2 [Providencia stuartii]MBN4879057.1 glutaredoxin 2 [Providencia stuartii]MBN4883930.1 glutaredoxin 2 [Providencia stuartii]